VLAVGTFAIGTDAFVIGGVLPAVARSLGVSTSSAGLLVTAFAIAYAIGGPVLAVGTARLPRRALMVSALALFVAANIVAALAPGYAVMLIARVFAALGAAAFVPAASAVASSLAPAEYRGRALGTVVAGMTVAQVAGVPFGAFVGASLGWRYTFLFVAALGAAAALAVWLWLPHVQSPAPARLGRRLAVAARPSTWPLLLQTTLAMAAGFSVLTYIYPVLSRAGGYHGAMVSVALLVFGVASVAGSTLGGRLTDRFGALPVVAAGLAALILAMLALTAATALSAGWPVLIALAAWGLGGWTFPPAQQHRLIALEPDEASVLLGLNSSAIYAGAAIGGLAGSLVLPAGIALVPAIAAGLAACAIVGVAVQHRVAGCAGLSAGELVDGGLGDGGEEVDEVAVGIAEQQRPVAPWHRGGLVDEVRDEAGQVLVDSVDVVDEELDDDGAVVGRPGGPGSEQRDSAGAGDRESGRADAELGEVLVRPVRLDARRALVESGQPGDVVGDDADRDEFHGDLLVSGNVLHPTLELIPGIIRPV
jgi:DHA1 family inner membrane transport protein